MAEFVSRGSFFGLQSLSLFAEQHGKKPSPLIQINFFVDGQIVIMDGHHRCVGIWEAGRRFLDDCEYQKHNLTYDDFLDVAFDKGWVTPYDPRTHVRLAELGLFKVTVQTLAKNDEEEARRFIEENQGRYSTLRTISTIRELHGVWENQKMGVEI
jgi:hypothetical protein